MWLRVTTVRMLMQVKLGTPIFIPNGQIGLFGAVTQIKSLVRNRRDLFDIAAAGPLAGGIASLALFLTGLALSGSGASKVRVPLVSLPLCLLREALTVLTDDTPDKLQTTLVYHVCQISYLSLDELCA